MVIVLVAVLASVILTPEPVTRHPGALRSLVPRILIPTGRGRELLAAGATLVATWSFTGFYQHSVPRSPPTTSAPTTPSWSLSCSPRS